MSGLRKNLVRSIVFITVISMVWQGVVWADPGVIQPDRLQVRTLFSLPDMEERVSPLVSGYVVKRLAEFERDLTKQHPSRIEDAAKELIVQIKKDADIPEDLLKIAASSAKGELVVILGSHAVRYYNHRREDTQDPGPGRKVIKDMKIGGYFSRQILEVSGKEYFSGGAEVYWSEWEVVNSNTLRARGRKGIIAKRGPDGKFDIMSGGLPVDPVDKEVEDHIQALKDKNKNVRIAAIGNLGKIGDEKAVQPLIKVLRSADWTVRGAAAVALGKIGDERAVLPLIQALKDTTAYVRSAAAEALGKIGDKKAVEPLIQVALKDQEKRVRGTAAEALGAINDESAVQSLILASKDEDLHICEAATKALGKMGEPSVELLVQALKDRDERVRKTAAEALGEINDERAVPHLVRALKDTEWIVRGNAAIALGEIGDENAVPLLIRTLRDEDSYVRFTAVHALGQISDERAVKPLIRALEDEDLDVREAAAEALGKIGKPAIELLIQALTKDESKSVRAGAAEALGKIGDKSTVRFLAQALIKDENERVREAAAKALGEVGDKEVAGLLVQVLIKNDEDPDVRKAAVEALGRIGDEKAVLSLIRIFNDKSMVGYIGRVPEAIIRSLGEIGGEKAAEFLIQLLKDEDYSARIIVVEALDKIGGDKAIQVLTRTSKQDKDMYVRRAAAEALKAIRNKAAAAVEYFSSGAEVNWSEWEAVDSNTLRAKGQKGIIAKRGLDGKFDIMSGGLFADITASDNEPENNELNIAKIVPSETTCLGKPTVRLDVELLGGAKGHFVVPAGTSTGEDEARTVGVEKAVKNLAGIHTEVTDRGLKADQLTDIARVMLEMGKDKLGAEATLSYQMASAWAAARQRGFEPYEFIREIAPDIASRSVPKTKIQYNITNGGEHAENDLNMQEFMVVPVGRSTAEANRMCDEIDRQLGLIYRSLGLSADPDDKGVGEKRGKEGGYKIADLTSERLKEIYANPPEKSFEYLNVAELKERGNIGVHDFVLECMVAAVKNAGYVPSTSGEIGTVAIALDPATSSMVVEGHKDLYHYEGAQIGSKDLAGIFERWVARYPITSIEDGMGENDWDGWMRLVDKVGDKVLLIGDDSLVTQAARLTKFIELLREKGYVDKKTGKVTRKIGILIKLNQNGFLITGINDPGKGYLGTLEVIRLAKRHGIEVVVSHRSKEAEPGEREVSIAELAAGVDAYALKSGDHVQGIRAVKEDRLAEIDRRERELFVKKVMDNAETVIPGLVDALITASEKDKKVVLAFDTDLGGGRMNVLLGELIEAISGLKDNNEDLKRFLANLYMIKGKGKDLGSRLGNITDPSKGSVKKENVIVVAKGSNEEYFKSLKGTATMAIVDDSAFPETAHLPLLDVMLLAVGSYLGWSENRLYEIYSSIPDVESLSLEEYVKLCKKDQRSLIIKLVPNAVQLETEKRREIIDAIKDMLAKA